MFAPWTACAKLRPRIDAVWPQQPASVFFIDFNAHPHKP